MLKYFAALCLSLSAFGVEPHYKGPPVVESAEQCEENRNLMGETDHEVIYLCRGNILSQHQDINRVLNHELIHIIHYNYGMTADQTLIPEPYFTNLVREFLEPDEVLIVLTTPGYQDYKNQELEARLLSRLPRDVIMVMLAASEDYGTTSSLSD